jgi:purine nucleoside permease
MPADWTTGYVPLRKTRPFELPVAALDGQAFALNPELAQWAFDLTRATPLDDPEALKQIRTGFDGAAAQRPPFVTLGDEISSSTYWHGRLFDAWATEWVSYFTEGKGQFLTTAMEDTGSLESLQSLARAGRVDFQRILVLRTVSNFDRQPHGLTAAESLARQRIGSYSAYLPSLEAAYKVGHVVVNELLTHWSRYSDSQPSVDQTAPKP